MEQVKEMSKTYQYRKVMKPMLERKRRARINKCLDELKDLMIECMRQQGDNIARLEKADILELTVDHLRKIKTVTSSSSTNNINQKSNKIDGFREGYIHAANEVSRTLATLPNIDVALGTKVMTHLGHRLNQIQVEQQNLTQQNTFSPVPVQQVNTPIYMDNYRSNMSSPCASSGYGSDNEYSQSYLSKSMSSLDNKNFAEITSSSNSNVWRPW